MALTQEDLQAIRGLIQEETRAIVQEETRTIVQEEIRPLNERIANIEVTHGKKLDALVASQEAMNTRLDNMQAQVNSLEKKMENSMIIKAVTPT